MAGHALSRTQRLVLRLAGPEMAAAMEARSRAWLVRCPNCGHQRSIWELGGIRYKASGAPRMLIGCPACGERGWHQVVKSDDFPTTLARPWPIFRLVVSAIIAFLILSAVVFGIVLKLLEWL
ncbi:MAG: hypothetical protein AB7O91_00490 [Sphingomonas sp.]